MASAPQTVNGFTVLPVAYSTRSTHCMYARLHGGKSSNGRTLFVVNVPPDATERELSSFFRQAGTVEKVHFGADGTFGEDVKEDEWETDEGSEGDGADEDEEMADAAEVQHQPRKRRKLAKKNAGPPEVKPLFQGSSRVLRPSGRSAHIVFLDESGVQRALQPPSKPRPWPSDAETPSGLAHYLASYELLRPPLVAVREHADSAMELYEYQLAKTKAQKSEYRKGEAIVDEDGFTLVTRGGAYGQTIGGGAAVASKVFEKTGDASRNKKKREKKEKTNFYAFQKAEKQRNEILNLKSKWEADKEKIEKLKASRKFKPY